MVALRSLRLETLLGSRIEDVTYDQVANLVTNQVAEAFDLDFKDRLYGRADRDKRDLATDVAALANTAGGLVVLGIEEDDQSRASRVTTVALSDGEVGRMRQIVASLTAPMPLFDVMPVEDPANPNTGFYLIAVPRSPLQPHAVLVNESLRFPRRNGSTTRYLSEAEVATAYRDRFLSTAAQTVRADEVERDLLTRLATGEVWVVVSLVPDLPGDLIIDHAAFRTFQDEMLLNPPLIGHPNRHFQRAFVGRRRLTADGTTGDRATAGWLAAELHTDGAGAFATWVTDLNRSGAMPGERSAAGERLVDDESVVIAVLSGLRLLARHARDRAAAGGNALIRAHLFPVSEEAPVRLGSVRAGTPEALGTQILVEPTPPAEGAASVEDLAADGPGLVAASYLLGNDLVQAFGLSEVLQLTRDGKLRGPYWDPYGGRQVVENWAKASGVEIVNDTLPG